MSASAEDTARVIDGLLHEAHLAAPHELPDMISRHARALGAVDAVAYLVDLQQKELIPFVGPSGPGVSRDLHPLVIDSTLAGRAYQQHEILTQEADGDTRVWLPLLDGTERLGVLGVRMSGSAPVAGGLGDDEVRLRRFAALIAQLVVTKTFYGDTIVRVRRRAEMGLAAEIQWGLLPPLTMACSQVVIAAALEPAYEVAGDSVDYAVDPGRCRCAVIDGMGHGIQSAQLASLAVAAYRNGRRSARSLTETARQMDSAVAAAYSGEAFATGVLAELDTDTGRLDWINAGHPEPLLLREGKLVRALAVAPGLPFGIAAAEEQPSSYAVGSEQLEPGDQLLFYTDGVVEARSPAGEFFGVDRLVDLLVRNFAGDLTAPDDAPHGLRALLEHQQGQLDDDATLLLVQWRVDEQEKERILPESPPTAA